MQHPEETNQIWIDILEQGVPIPAGLIQAIDDADWHWRVWADIRTYIGASKHPNTIVIVLIETFTLTNLEYVSKLVNELDLAVVVYGFEHHPMFVRAALEAGADDFISPLIPETELIARLRAVIRIRFRSTDTEGAKPFFHLDEAARTVSLPEGGTVHLTLPEYHLFKVLLAAGDQPVSRSRLIEILAPFSRTHSSSMLEATIARLRRKVGASHVRTIRGVGYRLVNSV